jgi:hypothetical protein
MGAVMKNGVKDLAKKFEKSEIHNASSSVSIDTICDEGLARNGLTREELAQQAEILKRAEDDQASLLFIANLQKEEPRIDEIDPETAALILAMQLEDEEQRFRFF